MPEILWEPSAAAVEASNLTAYVDWLRTERGVDVTTYPELWRWSVDDLEAFWASIWDFFEVRPTATPPGPRRRARCPAPSGSRTRR